MIKLPEKVITIRNRLEAKFPISINELNYWKCAEVLLILDCSGARCRMEKYRRL